MYHRDRNDLLKSAINKRLNDSLDAYYRELEASAEYLSYRKAENVVKKFF